MPSKKPWTVMVYLAADNNLTNFGIDSLKQMKAVCGNSVNIVAEFYSGPRRPTKRYLFDHRTILGSIEQDVINVSPAKDAGNPANLTAFVEWAANHYEAEHYFLIIWGHGAGLDDDFPRSPNRASASRRSFMARHSLLMPGVGKYKGPLDAGGSHGPLDVGQHGPLDASPSELDAPWSSIDQASKSVLKKADDLVLLKLTDQISLALKEAYSNLERSKGNQSRLEEEIRHALERGIVGAFRESVCKDLQAGIISAFQAGLDNAANKGVFNGMRKSLAKAFQNGDHDTAESYVREVVHSGPLTHLFRNVVKAMQNGYSDSGMPAVVSPIGIKSLAFSDHPSSHLSNLELQEALLNACRSLPGEKKKLDILGMDACDMNMVEIGYELRGCSDYLVAAQGPIPDASWPYDSILGQLVRNPRVLPRDLTCIATTAYVLNYRDYVDQPVALSVLDLQAPEKICSLFRDFTGVMEKSFAHEGMREAIVVARRKAQSFGQNQFVDVIDFCQNLAEEPASGDAGNKALDLIGEFQPLIAYNQCSDCLQRCNGTSIYFPEFDSDTFKHQQDLAVLYSELDFARHTGWGRFVAEFLRYQFNEWKAIADAQETRREAGLAMKAG